MPGPGLPRWIGAMGFACCTPTSLYRTRQRRGDMRRAMNIAPSREGRLVLALLPFALIALFYVIGSAERRAENPNDKLLPPVSEMVDAVHRVALEPDRRS